MSCKSYINNNINNKNNLTIPKEKSTNKTISLSLLDNQNKIIEICTKKLKKKPSNKRALLLRSSIYLKQNKYNEAKNDLIYLLNDEYLASTAYYLLGIINKEINNQEEALYNLTKSIELDNNNINAYFLRGAVNNILGNYKEAINDYNEAINKDSSLGINNKNVYKNISKIISQAIINQSKYSRKKQKRNLSQNNKIEYNKNNYINELNNRNNNDYNNTNYNTNSYFYSDKNKIESKENMNLFRTSGINYNYKKSKSRSKINDRKQNIYNYYYFDNNNNNEEEQNEEIKGFKNIVVHSTSNNFNFFIRNIADKKINEKEYDTQKLFKEINGFLNDGDDNDDKFNNINNNILIDYKNNENIKYKTFSSSMKKGLLTLNNQINNYNINENEYNNKYELINNDNNYIIKENKINDINSNNDDTMTKNNTFSIDITSEDNNNIIDEKNIINVYKTISGQEQDNINYNYYSNNKTNNLYESAINENKYKNKIEILKFLNINNNNNINNKKNESILKTISINTELKDTLTNESNFMIEQKPSFFTISEEQNNIITNNNINNENEDINNNTIHIKTSEDEIYCIKGEISRTNGNYIEAIEYFTKSIEINPKSFKAYFNRAFTYDKINSYQEAIYDYTSTIQLKPNYSLCYYNRGITYNKMGLIQKSIDDFSKAIEIEPNKPEFYFNRACLYKNIKNYNQAINDYSIVIKLFPKLYNPLYNRGICYEKIKNYNLSINDFENCIKMNKNNINPYYHLATIYKIIEKYDISIKYLKELIEIKKDYSPAYHDIGLILSQLDKNETAIQYFNKCIELDNKKPIYYHNRGWAYRKINPQNAINDINKAIELDNNNPKFYYNRASIYKNLKLYDKAIDDYNLIILKFGNNNYTAFINRAFCYTKRKNYFDAINDYTKSIELKVNENEIDIESLYLRSELYILINEYNLAIKDLSRIIEINPNNKKYYLKRASCYENIGNIQKSCEDYEKALTLNDKTNG